MSKIFEKNALILRNNVGTAEADGITYELTTTTSGTPLVKSSKTGRTWSIGWEELIGLAITAGVNTEPQP